MDWMVAFKVVRPGLGFVARNRVARAAMRTIAIDQVAAKVLLGPCLQPEPWLKSVPNASSSAWDPQKAYLLARASQFAYLMDVSKRRGPQGAWKFVAPDRGDIPRYLATLCGFNVVAGKDGFHRLSVERPSKGLDVDGFVAASDDLIIVAFSGTEPTDVVDVMTDLDAVPVPGPFEGRLSANGGIVSVGDVHSGFHDSLKALDESDPWWKHVERLCNEKERPVYITGHSLGGALALLAAANHFAKDRKNAKQRIKGVYTYGQAMIGDGAIAWKADPLLRDLAYRHVNGPDLGPRLPWFIKEFKHFGTRMEFRVTSEELRAHWRDWSWGPLADLPTRLPECIAAHLPEAYVIGAHRAKPAPQPAGVPQVCPAAGTCNPVLSRRCRLARPLA